MSAATADEAATAAEVADPALTQDAAEAAAAPTETDAQQEEPPLAGSSEEEAAQQNPQGDSPEAATEEAAQESPPAGSSAVVAQGAAEDANESQQAQEALAPEPVATDQPGDAAGSTQQVEDTIAPGDVEPDQIAEGGDGVQDVGSPLTKTQSGIPSADPAPLAQEVSLPEGAPVDAGLTPVTASQDVALAVDAEPIVNKLDVPDTQLTVSGRSGEPGAASDKIARDTADKLQAAIDGVLVECGLDLASLPDSQLRSALADWQQRLKGHASELEGIIQTDASSSTGGPAQQEAKLYGEEELLGDLDGVRDMRHQLECQRTGRDVEDLASAWSDPADTEREIHELRRARRQIRSLFGGMVGSLSDAPSLRIDDLISETGETPRHAPQPAIGEVRGLGGYTAAKDDNGPVPTAANAVEGLFGIGGTVPDSNLVGRPPQMPGQTKPLVPQLPTGGKAANQSPRPRSGGTVLSSLTNSSAETWGSQADEDERRRERRERRDRKEKKHRDGSGSGRDSSRRAKKDDGTVPRQWNWANEVVKASMDPRNQWEFPAAARANGNAGADDNRLWEQPRQHAPRGGEVASRARERAQEVLRAEREQQQRLIFGGEAAWSRE